MPYEFENRIKYMGNDVGIWEMAKIYFEIAQIFGAQLKYL